MKKQIKETHRMGHYNGMALVPGEPIVIKLPTHVGVSLPLSDRSSYTMGDASVKEGEEPLNPNADNNQEIDPNDVFAEKIKSIVAASVAGRQISGGLKGHKDIVASVGQLLKSETDYIKNLLTGKAADDPAMIKKKQLIDAAASKLKRMSGLVWPFK